MKLRLDDAIQHVNKFLRKVKWHMPEILGTLGIVGVGGTAVTAAVAGRKAMKAHLDAELEKGGTLTRGEAFKAEWKHYIPPAIVSLLTMATVYGGLKLGTKQRAVLTGALATVFYESKKFRQDAKEIMGDEKYQELVDKQLRDKIKLAARDADTEWLLDRDAKKLLFLEENHYQFFEATAEEVMNAKYLLNRKFILNRSATLNDFYEFLGIPKTKAGEVLGWDMYVGEAEDGYEWVDFDDRKITVDITGNGDYIDVIVITEPFACKKEAGPYPFITDEQLNDLIQEDEKQ